MIGSKVMAMWRDIHSAAAIFAVVVVSVALGAMACAPDNVARDQDADAGKDSSRTIDTAAVDPGIVHAVTFPDGTEEVVPQSELIALEERFRLGVATPLYASKRERTVWPFSKTQREFVGWFDVVAEESIVGYFDEVGRFAVWPDRQIRRCDSSVFAQTDGYWVWHPEGRFCSLKGKFTKVAPGSFLGHFKGQDVFCEDTPDPYDFTHGVWSSPVSDTRDEHAGHCFGPMPVRPISDATPIERLPEFRDRYPFATATPNPRYGNRNKMTRLIVGKDIVPGLYRASCDWPIPPYTDRCSIEFRLKSKSGGLASGSVVASPVSNPIGVDIDKRTFLFNVHECDGEILTDFSQFWEATSEDLQRAADSFPSNYRGGIYERRRAESLEFYGDNCGRDEATPAHGASAACIESLAAIGSLSGAWTPTGSARKRFTRSGSLSGAWTPGCLAANPPSNDRDYYARFYTFILDVASEITITLSSTDVAPYLYLLNGAGKGGAIERETGSANASAATMTVPLQPGSYTIEATTYYSETAGDFTLELDLAR